MPPALRNQRAPTAGDTPAPTAASSLEHPAAMAAQNRWRSSRRATEGRPGEGKAPRPDRSERRFRMAIATSSLKVLRRPLEPGTEAAVLHLRSLIARLRLANQEFHQAARKLEELCTALSETDSAAQGSGPGDAAILRSLPGVGPVTLATLLTEAAGPLARRDDAALRTLSGVAPVTTRSGKTWVVVRRGLSSCVMPPRSGCARRCSTGGHAIGRVLDSR